ncbi:hypothetical protein U1Q18_026206 [Sarracenia purpurea var. burkii]
MGRVFFFRFWRFKIRVLVLLINQWRTRRLATFPSGRLLSGGDEHRLSFSEAVESSGFAGAKERLIGGDTNDPRDDKREVKEAVATDFGKLQRVFRRFSERISTRFGDCTSPASSV